MPAVAKAKARRAALREAIKMHIYKKIYEFAASAGAFEGYVYQKTKSDIDMDILSNWVNNLVDAYNYLPEDILGEFQSSIDQTLGRAIKSLLPVLGEKQVLLAQLKKMIKGQLPESPDDFQKEKWFQE